MQSSSATSNILCRRATSSARKLRPSTSSSNRTSRTETMTEPSKLPVNALKGSIERCWLISVDTSTGFLPSMGSSQERLEGARLSFPFNKVCGAAFVRLAVGLLRGGDAGSCCASRTEHGAKRRVKSFLGRVDHFRVEVAVAELRLGQA
jgi:hypothetical protein